MAAATLVLALAVLLVALRKRYLRAHAPVTLIVNDGLHTGATGQVPVSHGLPRMTAPVQSCLDRRFRNAPLADVAVTKRSLPSLSDESFAKSSPRTSFPISALGVCITYDTKKNKTRF